MRGVNIENCIEVRNHNILRQVSKRRTLLERGEVIWVALADGSVYPQATITLLLNTSG